MPADVSIELSLVILTTVCSMEVVLCRDSLRSFARRERGILSPTRRCCEFDNGNESCPVDRSDALPNHCARTIRDMSLFKICSRSTHPTMVT